MFVVEWTFYGARGELESASIEGWRTTSCAMPRTPEIAGGVKSFIDGYLAAPEAVLVLQGPAGTGKRLYPRHPRRHIIRPGRCFARMYVRNLSAAEAEALAAEIAGEDAPKVPRRVPRVAEVLW